MKSEDYVPSGTPPMGRNIHTGEMEVMHPVEYGYITYGKRLCEDQGYNLDLLTGKAGEQLILDVIRMEQLTLNKEVDEVPTLATDVKSRLVKQAADEMDIIMSSRKARGKVTGKITPVAKAIDLATIGYWKQKPNGVLRRTGYKAVMPFLLDLGYKSREQAQLDIFNKANKNMQHLLHVLNDDETDGGIRFAYISLVNLGQSGIAREIIKKRIRTCPKALQVCENIGVASTKDWHMPIESLAVELEKLNDIYVKRSDVFNTTLTGHVYKFTPFDVVVMFSPHAPKHVTREQMYHENGTQVAVGGLADGVSLDIGDDEELEALLDLVSIDEGLDTQSDLSSDVAGEAIARQNARTMGMGDGSKEKSKPVRWTDRETFVSQVDQLWVDQFISTCRWRGFSGLCNKVLKMFEGDLKPSACRKLGWAAQIKSQPVRLVKAAGRWAIWSELALSAQGRIDSKVESIQWWANKVTDINTLEEEDSYFQGNWSTREERNATLLYITGKLDSPCDDSELTANQEQGHTALVKIEELEEEIRMLERIQAAFYKKPRLFHFLQGVAQCTEEIKGAKFDWQPNFVRVKLSTDQFESLDDVRNDTEYASALVALKAYYGTTATGFTKREFAPEGQYDDNGKPLVITWYESNLELSFGYGKEEWEAKTAEAELIFNASRKLKLELYKVELNKQHLKDFAERDLKANPKLVDDAIDSYDDEHLDNW